MKKRVLAALLALVMLFGALPMSVFAEDLETGDEFSDTYEEPTAPTEPDDNDLKDTQQPQPDITDPTEFIGIKTVPVQCDNKAGHYMEYAIDGLIENKCAELVWSTGSKEATLKLYPEKIAKRFSALKGTHTAVSTSVVTVTLTYNGGWKIDGAIPVIYVTCAAPEIPDPTEVVKTLSVFVQCKDNKNHYVTKQLEYLTNGEWAVEWTRGSKEATLKLYPAKIAPLYKVGGEHKAVDESTVTVTLYYTNKWSIAGAIPAIPTIKITCAAPEIPDPTDSVKEQYVTVACDDQTAHPNIQYQLKNLPAGSVAVQWDRTATTAKLVLKPEKIAEHYGKSYGAHTAVNPADVVVPLTYANDAWSLSAAIPDVHVTCKPTYLTLTYDANAPAGKTVTNLPAPQKESIPEGSNVVTFQLSWAIPVCEGYKFLGWTTDTSSTIATFPVENLGTDNWVSTTGNPNYILYAVWEKNPFHVTYRLKDENGKWVNAYEEDVPVAGCENHTLWTPAEKTGYKFTGWYQKAEDIGKKGEVTELFDKTWVLYGDFTPVEYTITYDYRDKDIQEKKLYPENAETYTIEDTVVLNPITKNGMFGKTFLEWRCDLNKDGVAEKITEIPAGTTGNLTVYAYWNYPVSYTVYDEDGNEVEAYCETINVPEDSFGANRKPKSVEKDGYEFDGWYQNPKNFGNPNKRTETQLFSGMARRGSNLLDYLAAQNIELDKVGHTHDEWYKYDSPKWKFGDADTVNGWTNVLVKYTRKEYTVVANMYLDGAPHYRQNTDFYTYQVTGLYGDPIDFTDIKAQAIAQAEKDRPASASYDASVIEDWAGNAACTTFGEHQPDLDKHYVNVHVNTTQHVYVYRMIDGKMEPTAYHHSTAPFGANVVEHLNANVQNLDMPGYSHDEWFNKDVPALDVKFGDTDTINGWTNVVIKYTKNEFPVTYDYACTDPALVPHWKVWETLPENPYTYAPGESVRVAMMPDDVEDGEYIWKFVTWKLNGVDVVPNAQVPMVEGGLTFVGIWERTQKEYGVTYDYACTDPALVPNPKVWATLPENKDTYTVGQKVTTAAKPDDVEDGEYIWKFVTWKLGDTEVAPNTQVEMVAGGLTFVGIWERTQKEYGVKYSYDPNLPAEVQATLPKNPYTYTVGQKVTTAAKPDSVRVGEYIWTFKTWKLDGVEVAPNTQVPMVSGGLHFEGIWETKLIHYSLTIQYVDKKGKELAESHMDLLAKGEAYKVDSPKIKGYKLKDKEDAVIEGTMPGNNLTIEVVYIKKSTGGSSGTIDSPNKPTTKAPALTLNTDDHFAFINGYPDGSVQPEGNVTRAETAAILYRIMGDACQSYYKTNSSSYSDVARGDWYNTYVATLENAGVIVDTRTNGKFRPNDAITRAELASMIAQFAGLESASAAKFNDVGSRYWAAEEIAIAAKMGWINGYPDGSFRPDRNVTRAELMAMVNRALGRTPKSADDLLSGMKTWRDNANVNAWYYLDVQEATNDHTYTKSGTHETWKKLL